MFEKEAEEIMRQNGCRTHSGNFIQADKVCELIQKGIEYGYNKANEWHYPAKGEYPNDFEDVLICFLTEDDAKDCVRGWYEYDFENDKHIFKYLNVLEIQCLKTVFAWKKLVLPELPKEVE